MISSWNKLRILLLLLPSSCEKQIFPTADSAGSGRVTEADIELSVFLYNIKVPEGMAPSTIENSPTLFDKFDEHLDFWSLDINSPGYVTSCLTEMLQRAFAVQPLIASNSHFFRFRHKADASEKSLITLRAGRI